MHTAQTYWHSQIKIPCCCARFHANISLTAQTELTHCARSPSGLSGLLVFLWATTPPSPSSRHHLTTHTYPSPPPFEAYASRTLPGISSTLHLQPCRAAKSPRTIPTFPAAAPVASRAARARMATTAQLRSKRYVLLFLLRAGRALCRLSHPRKAPMVEPQWPAESLRQRCDSDQTASHPRCTFLLALRACENVCACAKERFKEV